MTRTPRLAFVAGLALLGTARGAEGDGDRAPPLPHAVVDLTTREGLKLLDGAWKWRNVDVREVDHHSPGPDLKPTGAPNRTHDIFPRAGGADFDDSSWEVIDPTSLGDRRSTGRLCFAWYRTRLTLPEKIGEVDLRGAAVVLELVVDDYAEVWVDGHLPVAPGQAGGQIVKGWNAPNRVLLTRDARPGQTFQIAVFAANAPLSDPPGNYVWFRSATLDLYRAGTLLAGTPAELVVEQLSPDLAGIVPSPPRLEKLAGGFAFLEGPVWHPEGYLLFSDPNLNVIYRWSPEGQVTIYRSKSGYAGVDVGEYRQPGSNGLTFDGEGRLVLCEHGRRRISRIEKNGVVTVLADRYEGKRLNSPNDLVYRSDGALFFTDPPFGLPHFHEDPRRELSISGVYCLRNGELKLISGELEGPNGIAFSPDERWLYVSNWDVRRKVVRRYPCAPDGTLGEGSDFLDLTGAPGEEALDGLKVDRRGNVYVSGPGGLWIVSAEGKRLGVLRGPELAANFAWGGPGGKTLYLAARTGLYRLELAIEGAGAHSGAPAVGSAR